MDDFKHVRVGVGLAVIRDGKVLLQKRKEGHAGGTWCFPGGHLEKWEDIETAAVRELTEEAGTVYISPPKLWTTVNTKYEDEDKHYVVILLKCNWVAGSPQVMEPDKCECWGWYDWDSLPSPLIQGLQIVKYKGLSPI